MLRESTRNLIAEKETLWNCRCKIQHSSFLHNDSRNRQYLNQKNKTSRTKGKKNTCALLNVSLTVTMIEKELADKIGTSGPINLKKTKFYKFNKISTSLTRSL